ncbi:MAG: sulfur carrier protein ThiS [Capsulimonadaceae bacterium]
MIVIINGDERQIDDDSTIAGFLSSKNLRPEMVVVEHNGDIIQRQNYALTVLQPGDRLEVVQMTAGG